MSGKFRHVLIVLCFSHPYETLETNWKKNNHLINSEHQLKIESKSLIKIISTLKQKIQTTAPTVL